MNYTVKESHFILGTRWRYKVTLEKFIIIVTFYYDKETQECCVSFATFADDLELEALDNNFLRFKEVKEIMQAVLACFNMFRSEHNFKFFCEPTTLSRAKLYRRAGFIQKGERMYLN